MHISQEAIVLAAAAAAAAAAARDCLIMLSIRCISAAQHAVARHARLFSLLMLFAAFYCISSFVA